MSSRRVCRCSAFLLLGILSVIEPLTVFLTLGLIIYYVLQMRKLKNARRYRIFALAVWALFWSLGAIRCYIVSCEWSALPDISDTKKNISVSGKVYRFEDMSDTNKKSRLYLKDCKLTLSGSRVYSIKNILVYSDNKLITEIGIEQNNSYNILLKELEVRGKVMPMTEPTNEGQFDEEKYYKSVGICYKLLADNIKAVNEYSTSRKKHNMRNISNNAYIKFVRYLAKLRMYISKVYEKSVGAGRAQILQNIVLGEKYRLDDETKELYRQGGISHLLSISGLHISIIGCGIFRLLRKKRISYIFSMIISAIFIMSFGIMTGAGISTVRAIFMFLIYLSAQVLGESYDLLTAMSVVLIVMLIHEPYIVNNSGFQLSFMAVVAVGICFQRMSIDPGEEDDRSSHNKILQKVRTSILLCLSIQFLTLPITLFQYGEAPLLTIPINIMTLPLAPILLFDGILGGTAGLISISFSRVILIPAKIILSYYDMLLRSLKACSINMLITGRPGMHVASIYFAIVILVIVLLKYQKHIKKAKILIVISIGFLLVNFHGKAFEVDILDVGQGDGIYISCGKGKNVFIDGGSSDIDDVGRYRILPFLKAKGIKHIDAWFVSHTDSDHISGLLEVLESGYKVQQIFLARERVEGVNEEKIIQSAIRNKTRILNITAGQSVKLGDTKLKCIFPGKEILSDDINDASMVLLVENKKFKGLFGGDISQESEKKLIDSACLEKVTFFKADHHGSATSNSAPFLEAISPDITVASAGRDNCYGHPATEAVARIHESGSKFLCTSDRGRIKLYLKHGKICVEGY